MVEAKLGQVIGSSIQTFVSPPDAVVLQAVLEEKKPVHNQQEITLISAGGTRFPVDISPSFFRIDGAQAVALLVTDITERKRMEAARAEMAAIVESSDDAIISKTLDGLIQTWNAGAERLYGYTTAEVRGQPISILIPAERKREEAEILERVKRGEKVEHLETTRLRKDGKLLEVSLTVSPIKGAAGQIIGASTIVRDISTQKRLEASLRAVLSELVAGISVLGPAVTEIVSAAAEFSASATETATAVRETTTTAAEVKQTAQRASAQARAVSEGAYTVAQTAQRGKEATDHTVAAIAHIRGQMQAIADSIVSLSAHSQAIGAMVATVADLAEQSNLLAVNAAIEAARVGEQGRGFAVVAQEIRRLAEQSKQATAQVRGVLGEVQRAIAMAVLAAEQGDKAVEGGVAQSHEAGAAITQLAERVAAAAQLAEQIAAASQEQETGMEQVVGAMTNIQQASGQNVSSAQQVEAAATHLEALGQRLQLLVTQADGSTEPEPSTGAHHYVNQGTTSHRVVPG
jgi:PAS domain S-box-containing protein